MPAKPLTIGTRTFATKGDAIEHYRGILYGQDVGAVIPEPDASQVYWLLQRHPEADAKIGVGVKEFSTRKAMFNTRCFEVRRVDGTTSDFSFKPCLDGKPPTAFAETLRALRAEVAEQTKQMKWEPFRHSTHPERKVACAVTGKLISLGEAIIDHAVPNTFKSLAERFLNQEGIVPSDALLSPSKDNQYTPVLRDRHLAEKWRAFYAANAVVRVVAR